MKSFVVRIITYWITRKFATDVEWFAVEPEHVLCVRKLFPKDLWEQSFPAWEGAFLAWEGDVVCTSAMYRHKPKELSKFGRSKK